MRSGLFYAYFTHFSGGYALGGLSDVLGGGGGWFAIFVEIAKKN